MVESMVAMVLADQLLQVNKGAQNGVSALHYLARCWCSRGFKADETLTICCVFPCPCPPAYLQHYAQCELLPRDDEIADKTLAGQFAVSAHQTA